MSSSRLPLSHVHAVTHQTAGIVAREVEGLCLVNLRGKGAEDHFQAAILAVTGVALPRTPSTCHASNDVLLHWLGPREWLLQAPLAELPSLLAGFDSEGIAATDVTSGYSVIELSGDAVVNLLKKASHYDFYGFTAGLSVQTNFAMTSGVLWRTETGAMRLLVRRSFADYVQRWIADASAEYGYSFQRD